MGARYRADMRTLRYVIVDVFTATPLEGNPLAVFTGADGVDDETMQALARETNLSETTFLQRATEGGTARLRIFTPAEEIPFAGHPVLGSAWVIARATPIHLIGFETGMGIIPVEIEREGGTLIGGRMTQPDPLIGPADVDVDELGRALGTPLIGEPAKAANGINHLLCPVADVSKATPNMQALAEYDVHTIYLWAPAQDGIMRTRMFSPLDGIWEDPATGSAAGALGAHLLQSGVVEPGRITMLQGVEMLRPSYIEVDVAPGEAPRVGGSCRVVARGEFQL
jgi:trans-2,3-dihydro-3-hydroxyanthranilate isomerase